MRYNDPSRISHRQLYRQIVLALTAPFLLCAAGSGGLTGAEGVLGILLALPALSLYVIFLIRLSYVYENPGRYLGKAGGVLLHLFFLAYVILTGAYLLAVLEEIVPRYLITGVDGRLLMVMAAVVCGLGTFQGMQKRGRMAEVSAGAVTGGVVLLYLLSVSQAELSHFPQLSASAIPVSGAGTVRAALYALGIFTAVGLLPLILSRVEKPSGAARPALAAVWTLGILLAAGLILLQGAFGTARVFREEYPIVPLMAGANLPGDILGRFDVIWMGLLLYSLLFAIGSLQYYGTHILQALHLETMRWWTAAAMVLLAWARLPGGTLKEQYPWLLSRIFCPGSVAVMLLVWICGKRKGTHVPEDRRKQT